MTTRRQIHDRIAERLTPLYDAREAQQIARIFLEECGGVTPTQYLLEPDAAVDIPDAEQLIDQLAAGRPIQYVTGRTEFCGLTLETAEGALIPRPETEELVAWVAAESDEVRRLLDIGTGSGCIAIALKQALPACAVTAVDCSEEALAIARRNAERCGVQIDFRSGDALAGIERAVDGPFGAIVSNPPYIPEIERAAMHVNVTRYEPATALFVPDDDPLCFYRAIARSAMQLLAAGGALYFEIFEWAGEAVVQLLEAEGYEAVELRRDINDKPRMVRARKPLHP